MEFKDLKIGMEVFVKWNLVPNTRYGGVRFSENMKKGRVKICHVFSSTFEWFSVCGDSFNYSSEMIDWPKTIQLNMQKHVCGNDNLADALRYSLSGFNIYQRLEAQRKMLEVKPMRVPVEEYKRSHMYEDICMAKASLYEGQLIKTLPTSNWLTTEYKATLNTTTSLPVKCIQNKGTTVLFWKDGSKQIAKLSKDDKFNPTLGFLMAYFKKTSGMSRTQSAKFIKKMITKKEEK
jgi:hypothetical protein